MNLQNLVDYCEYKNIDLFEGCTVPAPIDITMVKNEIIKRCGLLTPVYSEPEVFKALCKMWFDANQYNFEHLVKIIEADYSPIENVYESDHWLEQNYGKDSSQDSGTDINQQSGKDVDQLSGKDTGQLSGNDTLRHGATTEHTVSAFNDSTYQPDSKDATTGDDVTQYGKKDEMSYGKKDELTYGKKEEFTHGKLNEFTHGHNIKYDRLRHGNIGVTTNNKLETEEIEWLERFNPYDWIAAKFERENFVMIY